MARDFYKVYIACLTWNTDGAPTRDYMLAKRIYRALEQRGIHAFLLGKCNPDDRTEAIGSAAVLVVAGASVDALLSDDVRKDYEDFIAGVELSGKRRWRVFSYLCRVTRGDLPDYLKGHVSYDRADVDGLAGKIESVLNAPEPRSCVSDDDEPAREESLGGDGPAYLPESAPAYLPESAPESVREQEDDVPACRPGRARRAPRRESVEMAGEESAPEPAAPLPPAPEPEKPPVRVKPEKINKVEFSVVSPDEVKPGKTSVIDLLMYTRSQRSIVKRTIELAKEKSSEAARTPGSVSVRQGSRVTARLFSDDIEITDDTREMVWSGDALDFKFPVRPPEDYAGKEIDFGCAVQFDGIEITRLYFSAAVNSKKKVAVRFARKDCRRAFVSYSHKDKARVVQRLLAIQEVAPKLKFWMDNQSMNAGDVWRSAIASAIKNADVFLLFWSLSARESAEVRKEWEFALVLERQSKRKRKNGARFISPVPLDSPSECPPPEELGDLHFGDPSFDSDIDDIERVKFWSESGKRGNIRFF